MQPFSDCLPLSGKKSYFFSSGLLIASSKYLPGLNFTVVLAGIITGVPVGVGEPVFDKLDAKLAQAVMSIGAVKAIEIGDGTAVVSSIGSDNNDNFYMDGDTVKKRTNHSGGTLGGMSDGSPILIRASFKPTPSIFQAQDTITRAHEEIVMEIKGRHDPIIGPRAVVVVESMCAITVLDLLMQNATAKLDNLKRIYRS